MAQYNADDHAETNGPVYKLLRKCSSITALLACILAIHSLLHNSFRTARLSYYLLMAFFTYSEYLLMVSLSPKTTFGSMGAYVLAFLVEGQLLQVTSTWDGNNQGWESIALIDQCTFSWIGDLIGRGISRTLEIEDLPPLPATIMSSANVAKYVQDAKGEFPGFWILLLKQCPKEYFLSLFFELLDIACKFSLPWILRAFLRDLQPPIVIAFFAISLLQTIAAVHAAFQLKKAGAKMKASIVCHIYDKLLTLPVDRKSTGVSIINLVEVDTQRIQDFIQYVHATWSAPLQISACMGGVALILGLLSTGTAIVAMLIVLPLFQIIGLLQHRFQVQIMGKRDIRLSLTAEIVRHIRGAKLLSILQSLEKRADGARLGELEVAQKMAWATAASNVILRTAPTLASVAAFFTASIIGANLSADTLFSSLLFFGMLTYPLSLLPSVIVYWAGSKASYQRIRDFLEQLEVRFEPRRADSLSMLKVPSRLEMQNVTYLWEKGSLGDRGLFDLTLSIADGQLVTLDGEMGSGKSTLLNLCLGSIANRSGQIIVDGKLAYMPQASWLLAGTIRDNILFGKPYSAAFYHQVIKACALEQDFCDLEQGDHAEIDTVGSGLSGGQKARVMLARMVYSNADIYLMDDPLAALDSKTKARIVQDVIGPKGLLKDKIRIVTSSIAYLHPYANKIVHIDNGRLVETTNKTKPDGQIRPNLGSDNLGHKSKLLDGKKEHSGGSVPPAVVPIATGTPSTGQEEVQIQLNEQEPVALYIKAKPASKTAIYRRFFNYAGIWAWIVVMIAILAAYFANASSAYVLKLVSSSPRGNLRGLLVFYGLCCLVQALLIFTWLMIAWFLCNYPTSRKMHADLMHSILHSPMSFFHATSSGEVLNRFTNDLTRTDGPIYAVLYGLFNAGTRTLSTLVIIVIFSPLSLLYIIPFLLGFLYIQRSYIRVAVQLREIDTLSRGVVLTGFGETEPGRWIIRTYDQVHKFTSDQRQRIVINITAYFAAISLEQWLVFRSGMLSS